MLPTKLSAVDPESERRRYKIVRTDLMEDVPGLILSANVETGLCLLRRRVNDEDKTEEHNFGEYGLRIVPAGR
jgi:hypothetical protein